MRIAEAISRVTFTMITPTALGRMCLKMIRLAEAPARRAASTNSRSRRERNSPRTRRARPVQAARPISSASAVMRCGPCGRWLMTICPRTAVSTSSGMMMTMSVRRISTASTQPRKYPETPPMTTPITPATKPTMTITNSEVCVPRMTMANRSRPVVSCPKGCSPRWKSPMVGLPPLVTGIISE
ncbi:Uncharacterised protein [Mycobacteroides abscessus subsp. abscessus]|nr:Uncharacterised protein [Mycobacteroides abscessus subsp. abscessus]